MKKTQISVAGPGSSDFSVHKTIPSLVQLMKFKIKPNERLDPRGHQHPLQLLRRYVA
jgi:hypothetical protein